jgi:hypothetical protein
MFSTFELRTQAGFELHTQAGASHPPMSAFSSILRRLATETSQINYTLRHMMQVCHTSILRNIQFELKI